MCTTERTPTNRRLVKQTVVDDDLIRDPCYKYSVKNAKAFINNAEAPELAFLLADLCAKRNVRTDMIETCFKHKELAKTKVPESCNALRI